MKPRIIIADSSPLIIFAKTVGIEIIAAVVTEILTPSKVIDECLRDREKPGYQAIKLAIENGLIKECKDVDISIASPEIAKDIHPGEIEAIALAMSLKEAILIDDGDGRKAARDAGLSVVGSMGILLEAKKIGLIGDIKPIIDDWRKNHIFRIGDGLFEKVLILAGERVRPKP